MNMNLKKPRLLAMLAVLPLMTTIARADIARPPQDNLAEITLIGKLAWTYSVNADTGKKVKSDLIVRTDAGRDVVVCHSGAVPTPLAADAEKLIGKWAMVTVMVEKTNRKPASPDIHVLSLKSIKAVPAAP